uniref:Uncharacterized protein n=1 Tax=Zea mays TaxID=4577 RepID=B4FGS8_MAIZE|nr:unknown [Zea mays]
MQAHGVQTGTRAAVLAGNQHIWKFLPAIIFGYWCRAHASAGPSRSIIVE